MDGCEVGQEGEERCQGANVRRGESRFGAYLSALTTITPVVHLPLAVDDREGAVMMWAAAAAASPFSSSREQRARPRGRLLLPWTTLALLCAAMLIAVLPQPAAAVRPGDFKKCKDSSFCRRIRRLSSYVEAPDAAIHASERDAASTGAAAGAGDFVSPYYITPASTSFDAKRSLLTASVKSALHPHIDFALEVLLYNDGTSRIRMDEAGPRYGGWKRYNEAAKWAIDQQPVLAEAGTIDVHTTEQETVVKCVACY